MRQAAFGRGRAAQMLRGDYFELDKEKYKAVTAGIHGRDKAAAQGQAIALTGTSGEPVADIGTLTQAAKLVPQAKSIVVPAEPKEALKATVEKKEPYKPAFANIQFAAVPYRSKAIVMDGDLDEWKDVPALNMTPMVPKNAAGGGGFSVANAPAQQIKVQWDNTGFYMAYDVKKADPAIRKVKATNFWEGDCIEMWVDTLNTKESERTELTQQFWAWPDGAADDATKIGGEAISIGRRHEWNPFGADKIQRAAKKTEKGWTMEVHVPKERFHQIEMAPGKIMGMNFSICTGTPLYYYWVANVGTGTWGAPDTWGDVLLAGSDAKVEVVDKLASELKQSEEVKPLSWLRIGDPLRVRVTSPVMNLSDKALDKVSVSVASRHGGRQTVILQETGKATGIFEGAIQTALETGDPVLNTVTLYEGETVDVNFNDQCRADGTRNVKVTLSVPTASSVGRVAVK
jgi:hypothetical protein